MQPRPLLSTLLGWVDCLCSTFGWPCRKFREGRGCSWCSQGHGSTTVDRRQTVILNGEGAAIQTNSMSQLGGSDPKMLPTSVNQSFQFTHTVPFLPEGAHSTVACVLGWVPTQLQDASGATSSLPSSVLAPSDSLLSLGPHLHSPSCGEAPSALDV